MARGPCVFRCCPRAVRVPARQDRTRADPIVSPPLRFLRAPGPARGSGGTGGSPGTLSPAPSARPHWLSRPVGVAATGPARTGSARGAGTEAKALGVICSLIGRAWASGRGLRGAAPRDWSSGMAGGVARFGPASPQRPGRGYSARAARRERVRRWRRARRERARCWRCSSCAPWPPAPRGQVRTGPGRGGSGLRELRSGGGASRGRAPPWLGRTGAPPGGGSVRLRREIPAPRVGSGPAPGAAGVGGGAAARAPAAGHVRGGRGRGRGNGGAPGLSGHGRAGLGSVLPSGSPGARTGDAPACPPIPFTGGAAGSAGSFGRAGSFSP